MNGQMNGPAPAEETPNQGHATRVTETKHATTDAKMIIGRDHGQETTMTRGESAAGRESGHVGTGTATGNEIVTEEQKTAM